MLVACVNQDPGVRPGAHKGAAVHVALMRQAFRDCGAEVVELDEPDDLRLEARLGSLLAGPRPPALVYERYALGRARAGQLASERGVPHVLEVNAPLIEEASRYRQPVDATRLQGVEAQLFGRAHRVLAVSEPVARVVRARGVPEERVLVRPNAVDAARFRPDAEARWRADPSIPASRFVLGFHGRLRPWHGLPLLVGGFRRLLSRALPVHLLLVGEGDWGSGLAPRPGETELPADRVTILGWRPHAEVAGVVARFDALALTYSPDAPCYFSPLKLLEGMAVGAVPVVPDLGDLPRQVRHGHSGLVYAAGDEAALAAAIERLVLSPELRARLGGAAVLAARERSWTAIAAELLQTLTGRPEVAVEGRTR